MLFSPTTLPSFLLPTPPVYLFPVFLPYYIFLSKDKKPQPLRPLEASQSDRKERSSKMKMMLLLPPQLVVAIFLVLLRSGKTNGHMELLLPCLVNTRFHSSEKRGLRSTKCSSETLQNLLYFMYKKTHVVFFVFHFVQLYIFTL